MNNTIYIKSKKSNKELISFEKGSLYSAMKYGQILSRKNKNKSYFIITENENCLKFNLTTIL